ncbi:MAG: SAM-dependent methyltransferase, partial [Clostridia bacterium]
MKQRGKLYGIGVGPGDPELMTIKAVRIINQSDVIVVPGKQAEDSAAYRIAAGICENLTEKQLIAVEMPMVKDDAVLEAGHRAAAEQIEALLDDGLTVSFLTLGDVTVYATYMYVHKLVAADGYETEIINGITS